MGMKMIRKVVTLGGLLAALTVALGGCAEKSIKRGVDLCGELEGFDASEVVVSRVVNYVYGRLVPLDTLAVHDGRFAWRCDTLPKDIYALTFISSSPLASNSVYSLLGDGNISMRINATSYATLRTQSSGSTLQQRYETFEAGYREAGLRDQLDSIEWEFYAARDRGDTVAMAEIKANSMPLYDLASAQTASFIDTQLADSTHNFFTLFLYYTFDLSRTPLLRQGQVDSINARLAEWKDDEVQSSRLMRAANRMCAIAEQSVEGATAKEVVGVRPDGDTLRLSSLRGQYVLIDFWASYCGWCRKEMPVLKEAYAKYSKDKRVEFLSVSIDCSADAWRGALEQEKLPWINILITDEQAATISDDFNIKGIPLLLLLDSEGRIVRRGIRGEEVLHALAAL